MQKIGIYKEPVGARRFIWIALLVGASACAAVRSPEPTRPATRDCIRLAQLHSTEAVSDSQITFVLYGGQKWQNHLPTPCPGLRFNRGFTYDTSLHRLCRGQLIRPRQPRGGACALGTFQQ